MSAPRRHRHPEPAERSQSGYEAADFMLLTREPGSSSQEAIDKELQEIGIQPAGRWELSSSEAIKRAARGTRPGLPFPATRSPRKSSGATSPAFGWRGGLGY